MYPVEFLGAAGKAFHKTCFRCKVCSTMLRNDNFCTVNNLFYCKPHYDAAYMKGGDYSKGFE